MTGEERRFQDAFYAVLERDPDTPPGPTAINLELGKTRGGRTPINVLNGRMNAFRKRLLVEAGFTQPAKWARWRKAPTVYRPETYADGTERDEFGLLIPEGWDPKA